MTNFKLGLYEKSMPENWDFSQKFQFAKSLDYDFLEICIDDSDQKLARLTDVEKTAHEINAAIAEHNLLVNSICFSGAKKFALGGKNSDQSIENSDKVCKLASLVNAKIIQIPSYYLFNDKDESGYAGAEQRFLNNLPKLQQIAQTHKVWIGFENMEIQQEPYCNDLTTLIDFVEAYKNLTVYLDVGNLFMQQNPFNFKNLKRTDILQVHIKEVLQRTYKGLLFGEGDSDKYLLQYLSQVITNTDCTSFVAEFWDETPENHLQQRKFLTNLFAKL